MRERVKCLSCGGEYWPVQADGSQYEHHCPPPREPAPARKRGLARRVWEKIRGRKAVEMRSG